MLTQRPLLNFKSRCRAGMAINNCQIINWIIMKLAIYMKLWRVKHENTAWHTALQESDEFEVPGWEDLKGAIAAF